MKIHNNITLFCGVPGVGKDYIAHKEGYTILSYDNIRVRCYIDHFGEKYTNTLDSVSLYKKAFEWCKDNRVKLNERLVEEVKNTPSPIGVCNTSTTIRSRRKLVNLLSPFTESICCVYVISDTDTIYTRNQNRDKLIPWFVVQHFMSKQCMPTYGEGFKSIKLIRN